MIVIKQSFGIMIVVTCTVIIAHYACIIIVNSDNLKHVSRLIESSPRKCLVTVASDCALINVHERFAVVLLLWWFFTLFTQS